MPARDAGAGARSVVRCASASVCVARLPFPVSLGPWKFAVVWPAGGSARGRRSACFVDADAGCIALEPGLTGLALAQAFLEAVVRIGECARGRGAADGVRQARRFAATLVEFALRNPRAWLWFNLLLARHLPGAPPFDRLLRLGVAPPRPALVQVQGQCIALRQASPIGFDAQRGELRLPAGPADSTLAMVAVAGLTEAMQQRRGLAAVAAPARYRSAQVEGWMALAGDDGPAWSWIAWTLADAVRAAGRDAIGA